MAALKPITIIGGGLAGLTLGIGLRQRNVPVTIWEAGAYPRHRVCGEFISGRGQNVIRELGLYSVIESAGMIPARTTAFYSRRTQSEPQSLTQPAWSVARFDLDAALANEFQNLGGELRSHERWTAPEFGEGIIRATGRRSQPKVKGWRWFGIKVHAKNVKLAADLEMHLSPEGYIGMSYLKSGEVNLCGLLRRPAIKDEKLDSQAGWPEMFRGKPGTLRHERLKTAEFDEASFCSVAGLSLQPKRAAHREECCIGDAITMIPPVTGNGMSMAFESAGHALEPVAEYSKGNRDWNETRRCIAARCDAAFQQRLTWAKPLQHLMFCGWLQAPLVALTPRIPALWRLLLEKTR